MDKRTLLALGLMAIVLFVTPQLFRSSRPAPVARDTATATPTQPPATQPATAPAPTTPQPTVGAAVSAPSQPTPVASATPPPTERVTLKAPGSQLDLVNPGAAVERVEVPSYRDLRPGSRAHVVLTEGPGLGPLLQYHLALGADTIALDTIPFTVQSTAGEVTFTAAKPAMTISYKTTGEGYRTAVRGTVQNAPSGAALLIDLPSELRTVEADTTDDMRHLAYGYKRPRRAVESVPFSKLDSLSTRVDTGGMQWVAVRTKYWLVAIMKPVGTDTSAAFHNLISRGGSYTGKVARVAHARTAHPLVNGQIGFDLYAGPQSWQELHALGNDLENVNPYASFMRAVVQPFATICMRVLLWMKATFHVNYGWVLVIFGVVIRLLLWPLNQKAMRTSMAMQRLQPELTEIQKKYKNEPDKQRDALVKLYSSHGMSPLSPMLGCLPMLLPMPVLFALYFVFQNTIEFRGVAFMWLPDISLKDPYYIIPIVMGVSMFVLSWIGMRGMPPNPQAKMMSYMMPVMFTVMFLNFASGLNLYYAVQNIAALPQQWLIGRERAKAGVGTASASVSLASGAPATAGARKKT